MSDRKHYFTVTIPMAGHLVIDVEATSEEEAIQKAFDSPDLTIDRLEGWEALEQFNQGNVCYCPFPWEATAEDQGEVAEEPE